LERSLSDASWISTLRREQIPAVLTQLAALQSALAARLMGETANPIAAPVDDRLVDIDECSAITGLSIDQLYRRKDLPFRVKLGPATVRFSANGIARWIRAKTQRPTG
jgi:predicted DNA-binding transcriptional regulator AlpA